MELIKNGSQLCFASAQTSQALLDWKGKFNKRFAIKSNLEEDKCPQR